MFVSTPARSPMVTHRSVLSSFAAPVLTVVALLPLGGCDTLTGVNHPDELDLTIESADVSQVVLVTSPYFLLVPDPECPLECERKVQLVEADTTTVSVPFQRRYAFTSREQYFVETYPLLSETATLYMRVAIDGREWYNDSRLLLPEGEDGLPESLRFVYNFSQATLP
jgi:hypothetical protein